MKTETMKTETIRLSRAILDDVYRGDTLKVKIDKYEYHFLLQRITKLKGKDSIKEKNSILKDLLKHKVLEIKKEDITTLILKDTFTIRVGNKIYQYLVDKIIDVNPVIKKEIIGITKYI